MAAVNMVLEEAKIPANRIKLRQLMEHSSINTTQIYMKMSEKRAEKLMNNFGKIKIKPD